MPSLCQKNIFLLCCALIFPRLNAQDCASPSAAVLLNANQVQAQLHQGGNLWQEAGYLVDNDEDPSNDPSAIYTGGLWVGGKFIDPPAADSLAMSAEFWSTSEYFAGPITTVGEAPNIFSCNLWDQFFRVHRSTIDAFREDFLDNGALDEPVDEEILGWPGRGNELFSTVHGFDLPDQDLAPFYDLNENGVYEPLQGEFPKVKGDQAIWWVFNDLAGPTGINNGQAMGLEVQVLAYATTMPGTIIDFTTYYEYTLVNKGNSDIRDAYIGYWLLPNLGCVWNDYIGSNEALGLSFVYDKVTDNPAQFCYEEERDFGNKNPIQAFRFLETPEDELGNELGLSRFMYFISTQFDNYGLTRPFHAREMYNYLRGFWLDGLPLSADGDGHGVAEGTPLATHVFSGYDPEGMPWTSCGLDLGPLRRRMLHSIGPFYFAQGAREKVSFAAYTTFGVEYDSICPVLDEVFLDADTVQQYYIEQCVILDSLDATLTATYDPIESGAIISLSPNPSNGLFYLEIKNSQSEIQTLEVYNLNGQLIQTYSPNTNAMELDLSSEVSGVYFFRFLLTDGNWGLGRLILE